MRKHRHRRPLWGWIGIIGGGSTTLALGAALHRSGLHVTIQEQHAQVRPGGAGIMLAPTGLAALYALQISGELRQLQAAQKPVHGGWRSAVRRDGTLKLPDGATARRTQAVTDWPLPASLAQDLGLTRRAS